MCYERIKQLREKNGYTQQHVAKKLCIAQNTYSQYETGHIALNDYILCSLADLYNVSVDYILNRTDI